MIPQTKSISPLLLLMIALLATSCVVPVNTFMESARTVGQGNAELTASYAHYEGSNDGESEAFNNNYGLRIGYGVTDRFDLRVRYIRLVSAVEDGGAANYLALAPKFSLKEKILAVTTPVGAYFGEGDPTWFVSPRVIATYPFSNNSVDISFSTKADFYLEEDTDPTIGFNFGIGLSTDLDRWALRPEIGLLLNTDPDDTAKYWNFGIGLVVNVSNQ